MDAQARGIRSTSSVLDNEASAIVLMIDAAHAADALIGLRLLDLDLVPGQDRFLLAVERLGQPIHADIAASLNIRPSTVSKAEDRLVARGLVCRHAHPTDGRKVRIELTEAGHALCQQIRGIHQAVDAELGKALTPGQQAQATHLLMLMKAALQRQLRRTR